MDIPKSDYETVRANLAAIGQEHLLAFWSRLSDRERDALLRDIERVCLEPIAELAETHVRTRLSTRVQGSFEPVELLPVRPGERLAEHYATARRRGEELIAAGRVAALTVAGGQGTRLGFRGPKGCFPISPVRNKPLFQLFAEAIRASQRKYQGSVPWYIMTSPGNDAETREFFAQHKYFGLPREDVIFFIQGLMPAFSTDGKILLERKHRLALSPDGHGGTLLALRRSGSLGDMARRGVSLISYFQVDNPLVRAIDPLFLGLHDLADSEMSSKAVAKADDLERVGNFVSVDGGVRIVEYSDFPSELAHLKNERGLRAFDAGNIAIHVLSVPFVERLTADPKSFALPWHRAEKKVICVNPDGGERIDPDKPNAVKLETFIFDAIPLARSPVVYETSRREEFSPVKNATGVDSAESARRDMALRAAAWVEQAGVSVPRHPDGTPGAMVEISPLFALDAETLRERVGEIPEIRNGELVYLGAE